MTKYAERIRQTRQEANETQQEFALKIGTTKNQLSKYELSIQEVPVKIIIKICRTYNKKSDWLLGLTDDAEAKNL